MAWRIRLTEKPDKMRGRKPSLQNVIPMRGDGAADHGRSVLVERVVRQLRPRGLNKDLRAEWLRVGRLLAAPTVDRLKPHYVDGIEQYCRIVVRLRKIREVFEKAADRLAGKTGDPPDALAAEFFKTEGGRYGPQVRAHPLVAQYNEDWRKWRQLVAMLGLSPADERNMMPGQGDLFDESEREFA